MPTNSIASPPARIAKASKPTTKSNPDVFSIKLNRSPIKSNHRYLLIAECLPTMGKRRKKPTLKLEKKHIAVLRKVRYSSKALRGPARACAGLRGPRTPDVTEKGYIKFFPLP